jgi:DNA-binding GntR family transcriptional regulator
MSVEQRYSLSTFWIQKANLFHHVESPRWCLKIKSAHVNPDRIQTAAASGATADKSAQGMACSYIRDQILSGVFSAGTRLKTEQLAKVLGISRMPVREALHLLHSEGLIQLRPNRGAIVTSLSPDEVEELFEVRAVLEGLAARVTCENLTSDALADLDSVVAGMDRASSNPKLWLERHEKFHEALVGYSMRRHLINQVRTVRSALFPYIHMYVAVYQEVEVHGAEHRVLLEIAKRRNAKLFESAIQDHVLSTGKGVTDFLRRHKPGDG